MALRSLPTDEGGDLGVDDAAGQEVKVVLHRVHHHRVSRVVAALRRRVGDTDVTQSVWTCRRSVSARVRGKSYHGFLPLPRTAGRGVLFTFTDRFVGLILQSELVFLMPHAGSLW